TTNPTNTTTNPTNTTTNPTNTTTNPTNTTTNPTNTTTNPTNTIDTSTNSTSTGTNTTVTGTNTTDVVIYFPSQDNKMIADSGLLAAATNTTAVGRNAGIFETVTNPINGESLTERNEFSSFSESSVIKHIASNTG
ncbi:MAG: hypothetical protein ABI042_00350, partial [Verrucomicrobiota bacterium]